MSDWTVEVFDGTVASEIEAWPVELQAALSRIVGRIRAAGLERVGAPMVKHIEGKLWEMRPSAKKEEGRALYVAVSGRRIVIVLAFRKKTQKTPRRLIDTALERAKRIER